MTEIILIKKKLSSITTLGPKKILYTYYGEYQKRTFLRDLNYFVKMFVVFLAKNHWSVF